MRRDAQYRWVSRLLPRGGYQLQFPSDWREMDSSFEPHLHHFWVSDLEKVTSPPHTQLPPQQWGRGQPHTRFVSRFQCEGTVVSHVARPSLRGRA